MGNWLVDKVAAQALVGTIPGVTIELDCPPQSPLLGEVVAYWAEKRGGRFAPSWDGFDLIDLPKVASQIMVLDAILDDTDYRVRFQGTCLTRFFGTESTGKRVSELDVQCGPEHALRFNNLVMRWPGAIRRTGEAICYDDDTRVTFEAVSMPLSATGEGGDKVLHAFVFGDVVNEG